jgi:hypothetical protein
MRPYLALCTLLLAAPVTAYAPTADPPAWELTWPLPGQTEARGLTTDAQGYVYAVDGLLVPKHVLKYDRNGNYLGTFGTDGSGSDQLLNPTAIGCDGTNVYVADQGNHRIQKFSGSGAYLGGWGSDGTGDGQFTFLIDVEVAPNGDVYALDGPTLSNPTGINRVQRFTSQGVFVQAWGGNGSGSGEFLYPGGLAVDSDGNVFVADAGNNLVQKFSPTGTFLDQFQVTQPTGIDADGLGNIYVLDRLNVRVHQLKTDGTPVSTWGSVGDDPGQFETPWDVVGSSLGDVFVSDNHPSILRFGYTVPVQPTTWGALKTRYPH